MFWMPGILSFYGAGLLFCEALAMFAEAREQRSVLSDVFSHNEPR